MPCTMSFICAICLPSSSSTWKDVVNSTTFYLFISAAKTNPWIFRFIPQPAKEIPD